MLKSIAFYIICLLLLVGEAWYLVSTFPAQFLKISTLRAKYSEAVAEVEVYQRALGVMQSVNQKELSLALNSVNAALPSQKKAAGLVSGIAAIATSSGVTLTQLEFVPGKISSDSADIAEKTIKGSAARSIPASLTISGGLNEFVVFLEKIQSVNQILGITGFNFAQTPGRGQLAQVFLQIFYEPVPNAPVVWGQVRDISPAERKTINSLISRDVFILPEGKR